MTAKGRGRAPARTRDCSLKLNPFAAGAQGASAYSHSKSQHVMAAGRKRIEPTGGRIWYQQAGPTGEWATRTRCRPCGAHLVVNGDNCMRVHLGGCRGGRSQAAPEAAEVRQ